MTIDEAIELFKSNAEYERTHGNLQGCLEFRQLAEWLEQLEKIERIVANNDNDGMIGRLVREVVEDGND